MNTQCGAQTLRRKVQMPSIADALGELNDNKKGDKQMKSYFRENNISLLEFHEGHAKGNDMKCWHYNYGNNKPETNDWHGVLWYNNENEDACRLINQFCECIDNAFTKDGEPSYKQVMTIAEFFVSILTDGMKNQITTYNLWQ